MKEEWLFQGAVVPVDVETTAALVVEIRRLIHIVGGMALAQPEQEPVAWIDADGNISDNNDYKCFPIPLYTTPPPCPTCQALARTVMLDQTSHDTTSPAGDIRALKHRIHELEGELIGYKKIVSDQEALLERQTARIVDLQTHIDNFDGEDR